MTAYALLNKLVGLHVDHVNPAYKFGHIRIASYLIEKRIININDYKSKCGELGIVFYSKVAEQLFEAQRQEENENLEQ